MEDNKTITESIPPAMDGASDSAPQANGETPKAVPPSNGASKAPTEDKKLSGKELKAQKQAEKAARRAEKQAAPPPVAAAAGTAIPSAPGKKGHQRQPSKGLPTPAKAPAGAPKPGPSQQAAMPVRNRRGSISAAPAVKPVLAAPKPKAKQVGLFGHLYGHPRRYGIYGASKDVHPSVLALGLQMSNYDICGSTARCVAMLLVFKSVCDLSNIPQRHTDSA